MGFGPRLGTTTDSYCSPMQQIQHGQYLKIIGLLAESGGGYIYQNLETIIDTRKLSEF